MSDRRQVLQEAETEVALILERVPQIQQHPQNFGWLWGRLQRLLALIRASLAEADPVPEKNVTGAALTAGVEAFREALNQRPTLSDSTLVARILDAAIPLTAKGPA